MISSITIDGHLGQDPRKVDFKSGDSILSASLGHSIGHYDRQTHDWVDQGTMWVDVQARADDPVLSQAGKGDHVLVSGTLTQRSYQGKDGQQHTQLRIRAQQIGIIPKRQQTQQSSGAWQRGQGYSAGQQPQQGYASDSDYSQGAGFADGGGSAF